MSDAWPAVRAGLIAAVLLVQAADGLPRPGRMPPSMKTDPAAVQELDRWVAVARRLGIDADREAVFAWSRAWSQRLRAWRTTLTDPLEPWFRLTGTGQGWGLFTSPNTHPHRFEVRVRRDGAWEPLYVDLDPAHDWRAATFAYRRVRAIYNPTAPRRIPAGYPPLTRVIARWAFADVPEAEAVQVRLVRVHVTLPGEPDDDLAVPRFVHTVERP